MKKVLITGYAGFVGSYVADTIVSQPDCEIIGTYRTNRPQAPANVTLENVDLLNQEAVDALIQKYTPDSIYHLAGQSSAAESFKAPASYITNNVIAELNILEALKKHELTETKILAVSTAEVYGAIRPESLPIDETTELRPVNPYAVSKVAQDYLGLQYFLSYKLGVIRVRPFNHIGPGQKETFVIASFAKQIAEIEKGKKGPVLLVGNLEAKRDFTDVRDIVKAYSLILEKGKVGEVYNIGSGVSRSIADMLQTLLSLSSATIEVKEDPDRLRPIDVPEIVCDSSKLHELTGWKPEISIEQTLQDILDYWRKIV